MSRTDLPENYEEYKVSKEYSMLGFEVIERIGPGDKDIKVKELFLDESAAIKSSFALYIFLALLAPGYLINAVWVPLLLPFSGTDQNGNACGWLSIKGSNEVSGFGKNKAYNLLTNVIKKRKSFPK